MAQYRNRLYRTSHRWPGHDYRAGSGYFVTICTNDRACLFGSCEAGTMALSPLGAFVDQCWQGIPEHAHGVLLDEYVVMPNHVHGIIYVQRSEMAPAALYKEAGTNHHGAPNRRPRRHGLPTIIGSFKSAVARVVNRERGTPGYPVWQKNYHDHIIRDEADLIRIRKYIRNNPAQWLEDDLRP